MPSAGSTATFSVPESFEEALASVRRALAQAGMQPVTVLDVSRLIEDRLGVVTPSYTVLAVRPEVLASEQALAAVLPLHVAVAARGRFAQVHVLDVAEGELGTAASHADALLCRVHRDVTKALATIAMRQSPVLID
jgi:uncharacterized protein (DUF302 family)